MFISQILNVLILRLACAVQITSVAFRLACACADYQCLACALDSSCVGCAGIQGE